MKKIEISDYPSENPVCGFVVDDHVASAAVTLLMATFTDNGQSQSSNIAGDTK